MNTQTQAVTDKGNAPCDLVPAVIYKGHAIEIENVRSGVQNVYIDGALSGWIAFPTIAFNYARHVIDTKILN
jgi:hypothetical protein